MPQQDGFELTRSLKNRWPELIIWGISAEWEAPNLEAAAEAGMTACLSKPLTLEILQQHLSCLEQPTPKLWSPAALPSAFLNDDNLTPFLMMQIGALDEALSRIASWQRSGQPELSATLHRLYGGMVLLGATRIVSLCQRHYSQPVDELIEVAQALRQELSRTTKNSDSPIASKPPLLPPIISLSRGRQGGTRRGPNQEHDYKKINGCSTHSYYDNGCGERGAGVSCILYCHQQR